MSNVLTLNGGSSSIRFAIYAVGAAHPWLAGKIERIGLPGTAMSVVDQRDGAPLSGGSEFQAGDHGSAATWLLQWLASHAVLQDLAGAGHRVVHGMHHALPERISPDLLDELRRLIPYDTEHLPRELELIEAVRRMSSGLPQVACFDTAFHRSMPRVATLLPIPRRYQAQGVQRYGFHGLSYTFLMAALRRAGDPAADNGRVILAHLGNGASLAAVRDGRSIDTSMGFTPASGLVMSSRSGDLDPGLLGFLATSDSMDAARFETMVTHESGLLGVSETSSDVRDLLARETADVRAAEALGLFCYTVKKWIGSYAAALGGVDTLVFSGGIGEHAAPLRARICDGLQFLGIRLDASRNAADAALLSSDASPVRVRMIATDEERVIAGLTQRVLGLGNAEEAIA